MFEFLAPPSQQQAQPSAATCAATTPLVQPSTIDREGIQAAFRVIADALEAAIGTDEPHAWSGDSDRLLRMASKLADREASRVRGLKQASFVAFDVAALIKAARLVPGDTESRERTALIGAAETSLVLLTGDPACLRTGAARAPRPAPRSEIAHASARRPAVTAHFDASRLLDDAINAYGHARVVLQAACTDEEKSALAFAAQSLLAHEEAMFGQAAAGDDPKAMRAASQALGISLEVVQAAACSPEVVNHKLLWAAQALAEGAMHNLDLCITALEQA